MAIGLDFDQTSEMKLLRNKNHNGACALESSAISYN